MGGGCERGRIATVKMPDASTLCRGRALSGELHVTPTSIGRARLLRERRRVPASRAVPTFAADIPGWSRSCGMNALSRGTTRATATLPH